MAEYEVSYDPKFEKQFDKISKNKHLVDLLSKLIKRIRLLGPDAGKLIDAKMSIYEIKMKRPPLRLYFWYRLALQDIYIIEYQLKTSKDAQRKVIDNIKERLQS